MLTSEELNAIEAKWLNPFDLTLTLRPEQVLDAIPVIISQAREALVVPALREEIERLRQEQSKPCAICDTNQLEAIGDSHCLLCEAADRIIALEDEVRKLRGEPESFGGKIVRSLHEFVEALESGDPLDKRFRVTTVRKERPTP